jgi:hypothetical protein
MTKPSKLRQAHKHPSTFNPEGVRDTRASFRKFLNVPQFPHPVRNGTRGSTCDDPEWLIMFMAIFAVKADARSSLALHRLAVQDWESMAAHLDRNPIPASTLRIRLQNICHSPRQPAGFIVQVCPRAIFARAGACGQHDGQR